MPINKNALLRYQILDRCFSDRHRRYEIEDLVDKVNEALLDMYGKTVSLREIRADITYMRDRVSYDAPIVARPIEGRRCLVATGVFLVMSGLKKLSRNLNSDLELRQIVRISLFLNRMKS